MPEDMLHAINELHRFGVMRLDRLENCLKDTDETIEQLGKELEFRQSITEKMQAILREAAKGVE